MRDTSRLRSFPREYPFPWSVTPKELNVHVVRETPKARASDARRMMDFESYIDEIRERQVSDEYSEPESTESYY